MRINEVVNLTLFFEMDPSRRGFLRKLGKGAMAVAGAAALSMLPKGAQAGEKPKIPFGPKVLEIIEQDDEIDKAEYVESEKKVILHIKPTGGLLQGITAGMWAKALNMAYPDNVTKVALADPETGKIYLTSKDFPLK